MPHREDARAILRALRQAPVALARAGRRRFKLTFTVTRALLRALAGVPRSTWNRRRLDRRR